MGHLVRVGAQKTRANLGHKRHNSYIPPTTTKRKPAAVAGERTDGRLGRIVRLLSDHAMVVVSGTKIADEIGTTRSAVWRLVQQLRGLGVRIAGHPATGYRLESIPDLLLPEILSPLLKGSMFASRIHHYFRVGSTNAEAMEAAAGGEPQGSVFLAEEQTAGRGRGGHGWTSAKSVGIYCSVILRPELAPADALALSLAAGLAVAEAIQHTTGLEPDLRWPNDVLVGGKKVCGILAEMNAEPTRVRYLVLGIGINVNQASFPASLPDATSLRMAGGRPFSRVELTRALLQSLDRHYSNFRRPETSSQQVIHAFEQHSSSARGQRVQVEEEGGYEGITAGLDGRGFLQVRTDSGTRTVLSGGVRIIE